MKRFFRLIPAIAAFAITACGSGGDNGGESPKPVPGGTDITLETKSVGATTVTVKATLTEADEAYVAIFAEPSQTPSLSELRKGSRIAASGEVTFDGLTSGTAYKIYGTAGRNSVFGAVKSIAVTTSDNLPPQVKAWQTTADRRALMQEITATGSSEASDGTVEITLDPATKFQSMEGFGPAITGSAAYNLMKMSKEDRNRILRDAFDPENGLGYNYVRMSIGCSDFSLDEYSCCDKEGIEFFEIADDSEETLYIFPVLREILAINPEVKIIAAPWSAPLWMKTKPSWNNSELDPAHYADYAEYFVLWIQEMEANGFKIESVTPQNEPLNWGNSASTHMSWQQQRDFVRDHLGPAFEKNNITTKIWAYDHNFDVTDFVINLYKDAETAKYFEGSAWHAYGGSASALDRIHTAAPEKSIYFTEQSIGTWCPDFGSNLMWHIREVGIGTINRYCRAVILWNFMLDAQRGPNRPNGGCTTCYGFVDCDASYSYANLTYRSHWYAVGHLSRVILRGSYRIAHKLSSQDIQCSTFLNPDGRLSAVVLNDTDTARDILIRSDRGDFTIKAAARSVTSAIW